MPNIKYTSHQYNLSLLVKQGWRVLTCPDSLFARIYKAKYFPSTSFLEAKMGSNPSYTWRSILYFQDLIKKGARIRVGTGNSVRIWGSPWLINDDCPVISSPPLSWCRRSYK